MDVRDLQTLEDFSGVVEIQRRVWGDGYDDIVPLSIFAVVVKRGGILVGAFDGDRMAAFVFSLPGLKDGRPSQWSHMLGVDEPYRKTGIGARLKLAQRERALTQGLDLIEWTFDPLQVPNAHLNFARLGVVAEEYLENVYGMSGSALHQGAPTDRFIAAWKITTPHVERRIAKIGAPPAPTPILRDASLANAPVVNPTCTEGEWCIPSGEPDLARDDQRLFVEIPARFGDMLHQAPAIALEWRHQTRRIFTSYFARNFRAVDFLLNRETGGGRYLLEKPKGG
jgi:predicted GNAT superfamily acetyltransferase